MDTIVRIKNKWLEEFELECGELCRELSTSKLTKVDEKVIQDISLHETLE